MEDAEKNQSNIHIQKFMLDLIKNSNQITRGIDNCEAYYIIGERGRALHLIKVGAKKRSLDTKKRVKKKYETKV